MIKLADLFVCCILKHVGDLGNISADKNGRASFRMEDKNIKVNPLDCSYIMFLFSIR